MGDMRDFFFAQDSRFEIEVFKGRSRGKFFCEDGFEVSYGGFLDLVGFFQN